MASKIVITMIGRDRPGLVDVLANLVVEHGGNWRDSRMARLGGRFAGMALIEVPEKKESAFIAALTGLHEEGLRVTAEPTGRDAPEGDYRELSVNVVGQDRTGIVQQISHALAERGVSIDEMATSIEEAPMAGGGLFRLEARLLAPADADLDDLRQALEALADDLMVEIGLGASLL